MRPSPMFVALVLAACGGDDPAAPAAPEEAPPTPEVEAAPEPEPTGPTRITDNGREVARFASREGSVTAELTFGGQTVTFTAPVDQISLRAGDLPTLEFPIGHVKLHADQLQSASHPDLVAPFEQEVLNSYGSPIQLFFDVSSVTDMVGRLDGEGDEAAGLVVGGLQANDKKLDTQTAATFKRTAAGVTVSVPRFEVRLADLDLMPPLTAFAEAHGLATPSGVLTLSTTLELPWFTGESLPTFVRYPVTVQRAREIEEKIDADVPDTVAAKRRLAAFGLSQKIIDELAMDESTFQRIKATTRERTDRSRQLGLGDKQREVGRRADGRRQGD